MDEVDEITKKIRKLTTSKKKKLIDKLFTINIIEETEENNGNNDKNESEIPHPNNINIDNMPENRIIS